MHVHRPRADRHVPVLVPMSPRVGRVRVSEKKSMWLSEAPEGLELEVPAWSLGSQHGS